VPHGMWLPFMPLQGVLAAWSACMGLYHTPRVGQHTGTRSPLPAPHVFRHDLAPPAHGVTLCRDGWQLHPSHNLTPGCEDFTIAGVLTQTHSLLRLGGGGGGGRTKQQHEAAPRRTQSAGSAMHRAARQPARLARIVTSC
jgi:hypothetical protein